MHDLAPGMLTHARFAAMTNDAAAEAQRRGHWMRMARERANLSQPAAAKLLGLSDKSASTLSAWEAGTREPAPSKLKAAAALYGVPVSLFYDPPATAHEQIDRMVRLAGLAIETEAADWEASGPEASRDAEDGHGGSPQRRSA